MICLRSTTLKKASSEDVAKLAKNITLQRDKIAGASNFREMADTRACSHLFEVYFPHDTCYIVACGLECCGCATNCARLGPSFICVRSLEQVRALQPFVLSLAAARPCGLPLLCLGKFWYASAWNRLLLRKGGLLLSWRQTWLQFVVLLVRELHCFLSFACLIG